MEHAIVPGCTDTTDSCRAVLDPPENDALEKLTAWCARVLDHSSNMALKARDDGKVATICVEELGPSDQRSNNVS
jgi:hypothetical protein